MAKSSKKGFRESVADYAALSAQIQKRNFAPIYLLMGEESYFIDRLTDLLAATILTPEEQAFNQTVVYGKEYEAGQIINLCRQMPMMGNRQVVIVREAQNLKKWDQLSLYTSAPSPTTVLVLCYKEKSVDKRSAVYKQAEANGTVFESVAPREYEIAGWLTEHLGTDLSKIDNELDKLLTYLPEGTHKITAEQIETNIGISKDFNNFELTKAISEKNMEKAMLIADHFARNPKDNPLLVTISTLFTHFQRIFILNYQKWLCRRKGAAMPSEMELARMLKLPAAYFLKEYQQAATLYPNQKVFAIMGLLREYDLKSKGINAGQTDNGELLKELLLKIFLL